MARTRATDFGDKQRSLLDNAAAVFAEQGMEKASMSQIAAHAQVSKSLLYHYYPSKGELIFAIISTHLSELEAAVACADDGKLEPAKRLRQLVGAVLQNYRGADDYHKVQLNALPALSDDQRKTITAIERRIVKRFSTVLEQINPELARRRRQLLMPVTMSLFGMLNWVYMWFRDDGPISREDYADIATSLLLDGLRSIR